MTSRGARAFDCRQSQSRKWGCRNLVGELGRGDTSDAERVQQSRIPDAMRRGMPHKNDLVVVILFDVFNVWNAVFGERAGVSPGAYAIQMDG